MNVFNRVAVCLILLLFIAAALVTSLLPLVVIQWLRLALDIAESSLSPATQLVGALLGLAAAGVAFLLLVAELRPAPRQSVVVAQVAGGTAELANESLAARVKRVAEAVAGVREASPTIRSHGKTVDITLQLFTDPDIDLPQKSEEVMQAVRTEAEGKIGVTVRSLRLTVKHASFDGRTAAPPIPGIPPNTTPRL